MQNDLPFDAPQLNELLNAAENTSGVNYCDNEDAISDLIRRKGITVQYFSSAWMAKSNGGPPYLGDTKQIAAIRCYLGNITPR